MERRTTRARQARTDGTSAQIDQTDRRETKVPGRNLQPVVLSALDEYFRDPRHQSDQRIADELRSRFPKGAPSKDTVLRRRHFLEHHEGPPEPWSPLVDDPHLEPATISRVLEVLAAVIERSQAGRESLSRREVEVIARLADATVGMDPWLLHRLVHRLLSAELSDDAGRLARITWYLAFRAWTPEGWERLVGAHVAGRMSHGVELFDDDGTAESVIWAAQEARTRSGRAGS